MRILVTLLSLSLSAQAFAFPWYASGENFRGAQLLTPEERKAHVAKLQGMQSFDECKGYMRGHYIEIERRAKEKTITLPSIQGDPCEVMKSMGRIR